MSTHCGANHPDLAKSRCPACNRAKAAKHHLENRAIRLEKMRAYDRVSYVARKPKIQAYQQSDAGKAVQRAYYRRNAATVGAKVASWRETTAGRAKALVSAAKRNARACRVSFDISPDFVLPLLEAALCSGMVTLKSKQHDTASLDRIKPELGYVRGNVQVIPWWLNAAYNQFPKESVNRAIAVMAERLKEPTQAGQAAWQDLP